LTTHNKSGVAYAWLAGFGPPEAGDSADLMEFACHLGRDEAMDLARRGWGTGTRVAVARRDRR